MGFKASLATVRVGSGDRRQTTCKICRSGIYEGQERVWSNHPLGLVHTGCAKTQTQAGGA